MASENVKLFGVGGKGKPLPSGTIPNLLETPCASIMRPVGPQCFLRQTLTLRTLHQRQCEQTACVQRQDHYRYVGRGGRTEQKQSLDYLTSILTIPGEVTVSENILPFLPC